MPTITELKGLFSDRNGPALGNRYRVFLEPPTDISDIRTLDLLCDGATLPGRSITTIDYQAQKQSIKIPIGFTNEDVTLTFILTGDYYAKNVFDGWLDKILDFTAYRAKYLADHVCDVEIYQMGKGEKEDEEVYGIRLLNAYPTNVSSIVLENSAENTIQRMTVTLAYENFEVIEL